MQHRNPFAYLTLKSRLACLGGAVGMLVRRSGSALELKVTATRMSERASDRASDRANDLGAPDYLFVPRVIYFLPRERFLVGAPNRTTPEPEPLSCVQV